MLLVIHLDHSRSGGDVLEETDAGVSGFLVFQKSQQGGLVEGATGTMPFAIDFVVNDVSVKVAIDRQIGHGPTRAVELPSLVSHRFRPEKN